MRRDDQLFKTMSAAKACIAECLKSPSPHDSLAKYLGFLRADPQWSQEEVAEVETTARKVIDAATGRTAAAAPACGWPLTSQSAPPVARS
jgi:hypothetical protein